MQVKVCPKCGAENKPTNAACSNCYSSLDGVELTEGRKQEVPSAPAGQPAQPPAQQPVSTGPVPLTGQAPPETRSESQAPPSPYGPPVPQVTGPAYSSYGERRAPTGQGPSLGPIIMLIIILGGAAFAAWWFFLRPPSPAEVVDRFISAVIAGDSEKAKSYLTQSSLDMPGVSESFEKGFQSTKMEDKNKKINIMGTTYEGKDKAFVQFEPPEEQKANLPAGMNFKFGFVMVQEKKQWKIDLIETGQRMMRELMKNMPKGFPMTPGRPGM